MLTYRTPGGGLARVLRLLGALVLSLSCLPTVQAQERRYLFELGAGGAYQSFADSTDLGGSLAGIGRLGFWLPLNFSVEAEGALTSAKTKTADDKVSVKWGGISVLYNLPVGSRSWAYGKLGIGGTRYGPGGDDCLTFGAKICGTTTTYAIGLGARVGLSPIWMARAEVVVNPNKGSTTSGTPAEKRDIKFTNYGVNLGVSLMLGSKPIADSDHDGVLNNRDRCADTPEGAQVDSSGCPADNDNDGVANGVDRCPNTAVGATVDASGCPRDTDNDNIADGVDKCPDTPEGVLVDASGCPKDTDGDSIADGLDRCSDTPKGATVDALGCPGDEDSDGVLDGLDRCPRTPIGATVNASGCVAGQAPSRAPAPAAPPANRPTPLPESRPAPQRPTPLRTSDLPSGGATVLEEVTFEAGSARLQSGAYVELDSVASALLSSPNTKLEIGGHTDNTGIAADNLRLSTLRAEAVRNYLVAKGVPFQQLIARGYGGTTPRTLDTTPRGRAANNRVEIRVLPPGS
jgi:outer membrane protein OmpA-like peptidoglycan-associated protein/opacity protein-like surface antigen